VEGEGAGGGSAALGKACRGLYRALRSLGAAPMAAMEAGRVSSDGSQGMEAGEVVQWRVVPALLGACGEAHGQALQVREPLAAAGAGCAQVEI
jgi:hypothetical protein